MKLINENEVVNGGVTIILFLVCVPKKRNLSISFFEVSKKEMAWKDKHIGTLEWKLKRNVAPFGNGKIFGARRRGDPYHLDLFCFPSFFNNTESGSSFFSYQYRIEHAEKKIFFMENLLDLDRENRTDFMKPCVMARIRSQSNFPII